MDLNQLLPQVVALSKEAGAFIAREAQQGFDRNKVEYKGFNDLVSYVDKTSEEILVKGLSALLPNSGFIAEEGTRKAERKEYTWVIDPLDGTTNFAHGLPVYCVSVALMHHDEVVLGVVYEVGRDECFTATSTQQALLNGQPISVSQAVGLEHSLMATGFPYNEFGMMEEYQTVLRTFMKKTHGVRRLGSAAADLAYVACGRFEGFFEYNLKPYDVAAGALIVQQAGGTVTDFSGGSQYIFGGEILAGNAGHQAMLDLLKRYWSRKPLGL